MAKGELAGHGGEADDQVVAVVGLLDRELVGERLQRAADVGTSSSAADLLGGARSPSAPGAARAPSRSRRGRAGPCRRRSGPGAAAAIASVSRTASETRSTERSRRAARAPTSPREHRREQLGAADRELGRVGLGRLDLGPAGRRRRRRRPAAGTRIITSVPRSRPPEMLKLLERAAISERPSRGWLARRRPRGRMPVPLSRTVTVRPSSSGLGLDAERTRIALVGVDDDVHAGLGDHRLQVGDPGLVHADLLGEAGQRVADDRHVLGLGGKPSVALWASRWWSSCSSIDRISRRELASPAAPSIAASSVGPSLPAALAQTLARCIES